MDGTEGQEQQEAQGAQGNGDAQGGGQGSQLQAPDPVATPDYEGAIAERDARIAELEGQVAEVAKSAEAAESQAGATGLPNAGAAADEGKTLRRWREVAGLADGDEDKEG